MRPDGSRIHRRARTDGSYCSASDPRVLVGLGKETAVRAIRVVWPSGLEERFGPVGINRYSTLEMGTGLR